MWSSLNNKNYKEENNMQKDLQFTYDFIVPKKRMDFKNIEKKLDLMHASVQALKGVSPFSMIDRLTSACILS